jgi:hypothetical protein
MIYGYFIKYGGYILFCKLNFPALHDFKKVKNSFPILKKANCTKANYCRLTAEWSNQQQWLLGKTREDLGFSNERIAHSLLVWICLHFHIFLMYGEDSAVLDMKQIISQFSTVLTLTIVLPIHVSWASPPSPIENSVPVPGGGLKTSL